MNNQEFLDQLIQLHDPDWQAVMEGKALLMIDDLALTVGDANADTVIIKGAKPAIESAEQLKQETIKNAASILDRYYFTHTLSRVGFDHQAQRHILAKGAEAFAATAGQWPAFSLFVEAGELLAIPAGSARHRYGAFCELDKALAQAAIKDRVEQWLHSGEAYQLYLSMNVCRYNC